MASPSALTLPAAAPARHFPISRRGRRVPRRQHPTGPLGGRDVRPCAGARSAARSGRASIVARDGPGLTISTVMDVLKRLVIGDSLCRFAGSPAAPARTVPNCRQKRNVPSCWVARHSFKSVPNEWFQPFKSVPNEYPQLPGGERVSLATSRLRASPMTSLK